MSAVASFPSAPAETAAMDCHPLRRIDFTCEEAGRELESVAAAQRMLLPARLPEVPGVDLAVAYRPARQAGGDLYDFIPLPGGRLGLFIADVTGHGAAAALLAAVVHGMVRACPHAGSPADLLAFVNDRLTAGDRDWRGRFVTAFYGVYDPATRTLTYANAGHPSPLLLSGGDAQSRPLDATGGLPLGIEPDLPFATGTASLRPGDVLVLYTDGVTEARDPDDEEWFGVGRLEDAVCRGRATADTVASRIVESVKASRAGTPRPTTRRWSWPGSGSWGTCQRPLGGPLARAASCCEPYAAEFRSVRLADLQRVTAVLAGVLEIAGAEEVRHCGTAIGALVALAVRESDDPALLDVRHLDPRRLALLARDALR